MNKSFLKLVMKLGLISLFLILFSSKTEAIVKPPHSGKNIQGYVYQQPVERGDGWLTASLTDYQIDLSMIIEMMDKAENKYFGDIHGMLIIKEGRLVLEEYFSGTDNLDGRLKNYDWDVLHYTASCTKSVTSALTGIAFDRGFLTDMDKKLPLLFPEYSDIDWTDGRQNIILEHLLTMRAGLYWNENPADHNNSHDPMNQSEDPIKYVLQLPLINEPGTTWLYNSGLPILLGGIIKNRTGSFAHIFAEQHLFGPLGIQDYFWYLYPNGYPHTGGGLSLRPRDMAKIGQLYLQDGMWNGNRIISKDWIERSIEPYTRLRFLNSNDVGGYGFLWWLRTINSNGKSHESYFALGYGGQYILVFDQLNMVVVFTANTFNFPGPMEMLTNFILPAMPEPGDQFTRIYEGEHVNDGGGSWGASWVDYDKNNYLDLFVANVNIPATSRNFLYHNTGDSTFEKISDDIIVTDPHGWGGGTTWGDYDNDGDEDAIVVHWDFQNNLFYQNNGNGTFTKIIDGIVVSDGANSISPSWVDFDNDGDLDLYVGNHDDGNYLYRNDGDEFARITQGAIVTDVAHTNCVNWADYDNDGDVDLFVANAWGNNNDCLYENNGDGTFAKITTGNIVENGFDSFGGSWGDYDNDGDLDLFVTQVRWNYPAASFNFLYQNNGDGTFSTVSDQEIATDGAYSYGSSWGDYDNDGDPDLFVANSGPNFLYENNGDGTFFRVTEGEIATDNNESSGAVWGDYDRDGDIDLFVTNAGNQDEDNALYMNNGNGNNWINMLCIGTTSNRSAIGVKVRVKAVIYGSPLWQLREISGQTGKNGQNSLNAHFGLGDAAIIDSVKIEWTGGLVEVLTAIEVNQFLTITEGEATVVKNQNQHDTTPKNFTLLQNFPNPFNPTTTIRFELPHPAQVSLKIYNIQGKLVRVLLVEQYRAAGFYNIVWNGKDDFGLEVSSGIFFIRVDGRGFSKTKKTTLIK